MISYLFARSVTITCLKSSNEVNANEAQEKKRGFNQDSTVQKFHGINHQRCIQVDFLLAKSSYKPQVQ